MMRLKFTIVALLSALNGLANAAFTVPVIWNVLFDQNNTSDGFLSDEPLNQNMLVINNYFNPIGLSFQIQAIRRYPVQNTTLHSFEAAAALVPQLRQGTAQTLNIFTLGQDPAYGSRFIYSTPQEYQTNSTNDAILIDYGYLPGGQYAGYNSGKQLVTAIGGWAGLQPTWTNGCNAPGDSVDDTAFEAGPATGCPVGRDTCAQAGADPIYNLMANTDDNCRREFTGGQYSRIAQQLYAYRGINLY